MSQIKMFRGKRKDTGQWVYGTAIANYIINYIDQSETWTPKASGTADHRVITRACEVDPATISPYLMKDVDSRNVFVGDIVMGYRGFMRSDGYLKKGFPNKVRIFLEVGFSDGRYGDAGFYLRDLDYRPEDKPFTEEKQYRAVLYSLEETRECELKDNEIVWKGCNETIQLVGNIFDNPELLNG